MNWLISFFVPSMLGCRVLEKLMDKEIKRYDLIFYYLVILLFTNTIAVVISNLLFGLTGNLEASLLVSPVFSVKYILVSIFISICVGVVIAVLKKYVSVTLEVVKNEKKKTK